MAAKRLLLLVLVLSVMCPAVLADTIYFPQVADGGGYSTIFTILNINSSTVAGTLRLFNQDGSARRLQVNGITDSQFSITVPAGGSVRLTTSNSGTTIVSGWALFESSPRLQGVATFDYRPGSVLATTAGVIGSGAAARFIVPVDLSGAVVNTGIAIANIQSNSPVSVRLRLYNESGLEVANVLDPRLNPLGPQRQIAEFVTSLFGPLGGSFKGSLAVDVVGSGNVAMTGLTVKEGLLSAIPAVDTSSAAATGIITSITPSSVRSGSFSVPFQINGTNLSGGAVEFRTNNQISTGISFIGTSVGSTQIAGVLTVSTFAAIGNHIVTFSSPTSGMSNGVPLEVFRSTITSVSTNGSTPGTTSVEAVRNTSVALTITGTHLENATGVTLLLLGGGGSIPAGVPSISQIGTVAALTFTIPASAALGRYFLSMLFPNSVSVSSAVYVDVKTALGAPITLSIVSGDQQTATAGDVLSSPLVILAKENGIAVGGVSVTISVSSGGGSIRSTAAGTSAQSITVFTGANGQASGFAVLGPGAGTNTFTAALTNNTQTNVVFTATAQPPLMGKLTFLTGPPTSVTVGATISPALSVAVQDSAGNTITTATTRITVALGASPAGGRLLGTTTVSAVNGIATFTDLKIDKASSSYSIVAFPAGTALNFTELPPQPVNNLTVSGVTFGFKVNGVASTDAFFASGGPGTLTFIQDPSLEGTSAGILTLDFAAPTPHLSFGMALSSTSPQTPGLTMELFDVNLKSIGVFSINTSPFISFTEALVDSLGLPGGTSLGTIKRAVLDFADAPGRFVIDNLNFATPSVAGITGAVSSTISVTGSALTTVETRSVAPQTAWRRFWP